jgi:hypothetical protein
MLKPCSRAHGPSDERLPVRRVTRFKSLAVALKELEPFVRNGQHLQTRKPFQKMGGTRSREILANWLLCVAILKAIESKRRKGGASYSHVDVATVTTVRRASMGTHGAMAVCANRHKGLG